MFLSIEKVQSKYSVKDKRVCVFVCVSLRQGGCGGRQFGRESKCQEEGGREGKGEEEEGERNGEERSKETLRDKA